MSDEKKYTMQISLNVLNHLGINLYSNIPAVIAEVIANAWDADATRVEINFDTEEKSITVSDNGCGMSLKDINHKYLYVGYQRRESSNQYTPKNRKPMGRKGIGKLSLFSIANKIHVQSIKDGEKNALLMNAENIKKEIDNDESEEINPYHPDDVNFYEEILKYKTGTAIKITSLKKNFTEATRKGLKKRIARRFSIFDHEFNVFLNDEKIQYSDRDYFHKARFLFQYGDENFSVHCKKLDKDEKGTPVVFKRPAIFDEDGNPNEDGQYAIKGWIGIAHHSNDLDEKSEDGDDNLNNIAIVVRGKMAQEDILHQFRMGALMTKYVYGEIQADFLDEDEDDDIATSSRQTINEDSPRYKALKTFIGTELLAIRTETDRLKEKKGVEKATNYHPKIKEWYEKLKPGLKAKATKLFGTIEKIDIDESHKATLYVNGILAFEKMKMQDSLDKLEQLEPDHLEVLLKIFNDADDIEAAHYYEIVNDRISKIKKLNEITRDDEREKVIQEYIFDHLWLLDPAWERATSESALEETIQIDVINNLMKRDSPQVKKGRIDIQYRKASGAHVIIELKRASRVMKKTELEEQINKYIKATRDKLSSMNRPPELIEGICIVGKVPFGWEDEKTKQNEIESLRPLSIKILTYDELIANAFSAYSKFIEKQTEVGKLRKLIKEIRDIA